MKQLLIVPAVISVVCSTQAMDFAFKQGYTPETKITYAHEDYGQAVVKAVLRDGDYAEYVTVRRDLDLDSQEYVYTFCQSNCADDRRIESEGKQAQDLLFSLICLAHEQRANEKKQHVHEKKAVQRAAVFNAQLRDIPNQCTDLHTKERE